MAVTDLIIGAESGGNPFLKNPRSSATGAGQFINSTWLNMVKKHRPDLAGRPDAEILAMRTDPELSREMTSRYADDNSAFLRQRGHEATPGTTYLAHFAGPAGAAAILANPGATVEALLGPQAVAANPFLRGKTGADVIDWANRKMTPSQHMAQSLRQRYGGEGTQGGSAAPVSTGIDRLKSALSGKSYDQDKLTDAEKLMGRGQEIASTSGNAIGAIGGTILSGLGAYSRGQEQGNKRGHDTALREGLSTSTDPVAAARLMMASSDPKMQAAGVELFSKLQIAAQKGAESYSKTPIWGVDKDGNPALVQVSDQGKAVQTQLPGGVKIGKDPIKVDAGTHFILLDPVTRQPVGQLPKDVAGEAAQTKLGTEKAAAQVDLPRVESNSESMLSQIDAVRTDPYLPSMTGPVDTYLPNLSGDANRVQSKVDQLGGQAFLQAFQALKGGGAITEIEGQKATAALSRLQSMGVNDKDYTTALDDFKAEVLRLRELARTRANGGAAAAPAPDTPPPVVRWERGPDGKPRQVK